MKINVEIQLQKLNIIYTYVYIGRLLIDWVREGESYQNKVSE
jgi:hypothetical protein